MYHAAFVCFALSPSYGAAQDVWSPDKMYCLMSADAAAPLMALCHDNYAYILRISRGDNDIATFRNGDLVSDGQRAALQVENCFTRADLSLMCMFKAAAGDD